MQIHTLNYSSCARRKEHKQQRIYFYICIYMGYCEKLINYNKPPNQYQFKKLGENHSSDEQLTNTFT